MMLNYLMMYHLDPTMKIKAMILPASPNAITMLTSRLSSTCSETLRNKIQRSSLKRYQVKQSPSPKLDPRRTWSMEFEPVIISESQPSTMIVPRATDQSPKHMVFDRFLACGSSERPKSSNVSLSAFLKSNSLDPLMSWGSKYYKKMITRTVALEKICPEGDPKSLSSQSYPRIVCPYTI